MIGDRPVERRLAEYFADERATRAPEWVLDSVLVQVDVVGQRREASRRIIVRWRALPRARRTLILLAAVLAVAGAVAIGSFLLLRPKPVIPSPSLVVVQHPAGAPPDPSEPVSIVSVDGTGRVKPVVTLTSSQLGGVYSEWWAALSFDGHLALPVTVDDVIVPGIIDLRDPSRPASHPDGSGALPAFGPNGRLAYQLNSGRYVIYDPSTTTTTLSGASPGGTPIAIGFAPVWAASGQGFIGASPNIGLSRLDGSFVDGPTAAYYGGVGPRRVDAVGRVLRCSADDASCEPGATLSAEPSLGDEPVFWRNEQPGTRIADFAWASDHAIWVLLETTSTGPRAVTLARIDAADRMDRIAEFDGVADDADPNSWFQAASFAAMAPDDSRLAVRLSGAQGAFGQLWLVDPKAHSKVRLPDGMAAGWLTPETLTAPRPTVTPAIATDPTLRGDWWNGRDEVHIGSTLTTLGTGGYSRSLTMSSQGPGQVLVTSDPPAFGCASGTKGTYRWSVETDSMTLTSVDDVCADRADHLAGAYRRTLPYPDTGTPRATAGATYVMAGGSVQYTFRVPDGSTTLVEAHSGSDMTISDPSTDGATTVSVLAPLGFRRDMCSHFSSEPSTGPTILIQDLLSLGPTLVGHEIKPVVIGGIEARGILVDAVVGCDAPRPFASDATASLTPGARIYVVPIDRSREIIVVIARRGTPDPGADRFVGSVLGSIAFEP